MNIDEIDRILVSGVNCYNWKKHFAWLPVKTISGRTVWFKSIFVRRIRVISRIDLDLNPVVDIIQYGTPFDVLANKYDKFIKDKT